VPVGVRVTKADGRRRFVRFDPGTTREDAIALAPVLAERARHALDEDTRETVSEYAKRWCDWRKSRGLGCVENDSTALERHVLPTFGVLEMTAVTRNDLKRLVLLLDAKTRTGFNVDANGLRKSFGWKTAVNVWSVVRAMFRDARSAKRLDLCIRDDNPAEGIAGPDTGIKKAKVYLWPSEFLALVSDRRVPVRWRRLSPSRSTRTREPASSPPCRGVTSIWSTPPSTSTARSTACAHERSSKERRRSRHGGSRLSEL
jgi:hypothetical protein